MMGWRVRKSESARLSSDGRTVFCDSIVVDARLALRKAG